MKIHRKIVAHIDKIKFVATGVVNTALDFMIFNSLSLLVGLPVVIANTFSTGIAMVFSFVVNKKWVFDSKDKNQLREILLFSIFTIIGMWVINNSVVWFITTFLLAGMPEFLHVNLAKIVATGASMTWNYLTYKYFVFGKKGQGNGPN